MYLNPACLTVHQSEIQTDGFRSLSEGERVEFEITTDQGRSKAVRVTGPNGGPVQGSSGGGGGGRGFGGGRGGGRGGGGGGFGGGRGRLQFYTMSYFTMTYRNIQQLETKVGIGDCRLVAKYDF